MSDSSIVIIQGTVGLYTVATRCHTCFAVTLKYTEDSSLTILQHNTSTLFDIHSLWGISESLHDFWREWLPDLCPRQYSKTFSFFCVLTNCLSNVFCLLIVSSHWMTLGSQEFGAPMMCCLASRPWLSFFLLWSIQACDYCRTFAGTLSTCFVW